MLKLSIDETVKPGTGGRGLSKERMKMIRTQELKQAKAEIYIAPERPAQATQ